MKRHLILIGALALVLAACGGDSGPDTTLPPTTDPTTPTTQPPGGTTVPGGNEDGVLLQVSFEGGFAPIEFVLNRVPSYTLFTDGRLITEGATIEIFPGPALPNLQQSQVSAVTMEEILELIEIIGLPDIDEKRNNDAADFVADAADTVVRYFDANGAHLYSVYALGIGGSPEDPNAQPSDEVLNLGLLVEKLATATGESPTTPYEPTMLQLVLLSEDQGFVDPQFANSMPWPFEGVTLDDFEGEGAWTCTTMEGDAVPAVVAALSEANQLTTYELDGAEHRVLVRPLLPGEEPCPMIG